MGGFRFPVGLCEDLTQLIRNFWWGNEKKWRCTHWAPWDKLIRLKQGGGFGFRDFKLFNQALLTRQAWRLISSPETICARLLKARFYHRGQSNDTASIQNSSPVWQGINRGLDLLKHGIISRIGSGAKVRIWHDSANLGKARVTSISDLLLHNPKRWNVDLIWKFFIHMMQRWSLISAYLIMVKMICRLGTMRKWQVFCSERLSSCCKFDIEPGEGAE